jgi:DNA invertase Pin-like site-specific DNA recombinase
MTSSLNRAAYLRVSTDAQTDGLGLDVQRDAIESWAREHAHTVVGWYEDAGVSGSNGLEHREGLAAALAALKDRTVTVSSSTGSIGWHVT